MTPRDALHHYFAFPEFRPGQEAALEHALAGRDTLVVMPTGSGKSLIYQLAALILPGTALVISPLVALMKDQMDSLTRRGLPATFINSSLTTAEQAKRLRDIAGGKYKIILIAPERLRNRPFREALAKVHLSFLAVDEAHCISQWGHDFRPDYLHLAQARRELNPPLTLALTATATPRIQDDIIVKLGLPRAEKIITGFNRPNLTFEVFSAPSSAAKQRLLRDFLQTVEGASNEAGGIIYVGTRREAEAVAAFIGDLGLPVQHYHAGLDSDTRSQIQDSFLAGDLPFIVATNAFGMGIDRPDVRFVLHYSMPGTLEAYYQEAGRAGRDGLPARVVLFYSPRDAALHEFFIENDSPSALELRTVHNFLRSLPPLSHPERSETQSKGATGEEPGVRVTTWDGDSLARPLVAASLSEIEQATQLPQVKTRVALEQLQAANAIRRAADEFFGQLRLEVLPLPDATLSAIAKQVAERREHKRYQLELMTHYAETGACRRQTLLRHFGDSGDAAAPACCDNCLSRAETAEAAPARPAQSQAERAALIVLDTIATLKWDVGKGKLAQVLKGDLKIESARPEYKANRNFGKFTALKLKEIESLISQLLESGYVKQVGGDRPTLKLTARGESALKAKAAIDVELRPVQAVEAQRQKAKTEAGGTVALSGQLLARGLSPEQIAAERGLTVGTVYSHLGALIAAGQVDVNAVVPADIQKQIRSVIETVGSVQQLSALKAHLPDTIDYGQIRCVVNAWLREHEPSAAAPTPQTSAASADGGGLFERLRAWRLEKARALKMPPYVIFWDQTLHAIVAARPKSLKELEAVRGVGQTKAEQYGEEVLSLIRSGP
ncbi:MAG: RecQ family ATP-dependent DNA helicase [Chloroflexi bacterium]|nr:RecQ family ATP-dependent DNA helicase [Chloroflexota bacterium]